MNEESNNPNIEPELEARIVALVLGEASDFEVEELNRLIAARPELAAFRLQMQNSHDLLQETATGEFEAPADDWKLPTNKRNAVLAAIRGEATVPAAIQGVSSAVQNGMSARRRWRWKLAATLGGACLAGVVGVMAWPSLFVQSSDSALVASNQSVKLGDDFAGGTDLTFSLEGPTVEVPGMLSYMEPAGLGESLASRVQIHGIDEDVRLSGRAMRHYESSDRDAGFSSLRHSTGFEDGQKSNSNEALSALRNTLDTGISATDDFDVSVADSSIVMPKPQRAGGVWGFEPEQTEVTRGLDDMLSELTTPEEADTASFKAADGLALLDESDESRSRGQSLPRPNRSTMDRIVRMRAQAGHLPPMAGDGANLSASDEGTLNLRGEVNAQAMQDLGTLALKGNEADVEKVSKIIEQLESKLAPANEAIAKSEALSLHSRLDSKVSTENAPFAAPVMNESQEQLLSEAGRLHDVLRLNNIEPNTIVSGPVDGEVETVDGSGQRSQKNAAGTQELIAQNDEWFSKGFGEVNGAANAGRFKDSQQSGPGADRFDSLGEKRRFVRPEVKSPEVQVPDGGSVMLGGIVAGRSPKSATGNVDLYVTPRIIIQEEEEEPLLGFTAEPGKQAGESELAQGMAPVDGSVSIAKVDPPKFDSDQVFRFYVPIDRRTAGTAGSAPAETLNKLNRDFQNAPDAPDAPTADDSIDAIRSLGESIVMSGANPGDTIQPAEAGPEPVNREVVTPDLSAGFAVGGKVRQSVRQMMKESGGGIATGGSGGGDGFGFGAGGGDATGGSGGTVGDTTGGAGGTTGVGNVTGGGGGTGTGTGSGSGSGSGSSGGNSSDNIVPNLALPGTQNLGRLFRSGATDGDSVAGGTATGGTGGSVDGKKDFSGYSGGSNGKALEHFNKSKVGEAAEGFGSSPSEFDSSAIPNIGPMYPYPQVPLEWSAPVLTWDDGHGDLKFEQKKGADRSLFSPPDYVDTGVGTGRESGSGSGSGSGSSGGSGFGNNVTNPASPGTPNDWQRFRLETMDGGRVEGFGEATGQGDGFSNDFGLGTGAVPVQVPESTVRVMELQQPGSVDGLDSLAQELLEGLFDGPVELEAEGRPADTSGAENAGDIMAPEGRTGRLMFGAPVNSDAGIAGAEGVVSSDAQSVVTRDVTQAQEQAQKPPQIAPESADVIKEIDVENVEKFGVELGWQDPNQLKDLMDRQKSSLAEGRGVADSWEKLPAVKSKRQSEVKRKSREQAPAQIAAPVQNKREYSDLTTEFDELMSQRRYAEAELLARKAKGLNPNDSQSIVMVEKAKLRRQIQFIEQVKDDKADNALKALNGIDEAFVASVEDYSFPQSGKELSDRRASNYGRASARTRTESELTIEKSLGEAVSLHFHSVPLTDVIRHIATTHGINIALDTRAIETEGVMADVAVNIDVDGITLRSALNLLLQQAGGLVYDIENEVLKITNWPKPTVRKIAPVAGLNEKTAATEAFSTFSLHVSDVSFKLALAALGKGEWPEAAKVRIEEFVNAFDYGDPMPCNGAKVACAIEQSIHPFVQQRNLLRVSMKTAAEGRASKTPLRLTFLLDNSGSMERIDRQQMVRRAFAMLAQQLKPIDQVTLISFARQPRLLADKVSGNEAGKLVGLIDELPSEGGTNIEAALQLAFEKANELQTAGAQNRIILLTDGAVNLGNANPESLSEMVTTMRSSGIAFDAAGISAEGLNDEVLEALTRQGDGRYYLLDSLESADDGFAKQIAGALRPSAKNVKVQVEFNPKRVGHYKLLGFEKHVLKKQDFRNDKVDAAEMAAAEAGVAMYQFEAMPDGEGDVGSVSVRFRDLSTGQMVENRWPIPYEADAPRPDQASASLRIATSAAMLAARLKGEPLGASVDLQELSRLVSGMPEQIRSEKRVQQLQRMIDQARQLDGK